MKKTFIIRKYAGDDKYSWAVFDTRSGRPVCTGCLRSEAQFHRDQLEKGIEVKNSFKHRRN
jgi:hypothetical protein